MRLGTVLVIALAAWFVALWVRKRVRAAHEQRLPPGVTAPGAAARVGSTDHFDACVQALRAFATEYRLSFQGGACGKRSVMALLALRDEALRHMYQLRMRLPNDVRLETEVTQHIEDTDALLRDYIRDAQERCKVPMLFPGPLDDAFYKDRYRAANDETV